jgi:hypothetical protein
MNKETEMATIADRKQRLPRPEHRITGPRRRAAVLAGMICIAALCAGGCASPGSAGKQDAARNQAAPSFLKERWGIEVTSIRLSGHDHLVDFRYRVLDPVKAAALGDRHNKACMIDQATGTRLLVPDFPTIGPMKQSASRMEPGKIYFVMFANAGRVVKAGNKVTVEIGDFRAENLTVEL